MKKYIIYDELLNDFLGMYCEGKGYLWNAFFGWRGQHYKNQKWEYSIFIIPRKIYNLAVNLVSYYPKKKNIN